MLEGSRYRSTTWTRHPLKRLLRNKRFFLVGPLLLAGLLVFSSIASAAGGPDGYLALGASNFKIRFVPGTVGAVVDWANSGVGTTFSNPASCGTAPAGYTFVQLPGTGGVFDCGLKPSTTNTACFGGAACTSPLPPVLTPLAISQGLVLGKNADFIVDPLGSDTTSCPTRGDPTVFTGQGSETNDGNLNDFTYNTGSVPTKDEISNAYAIVPLPSNTANGKTHEIFFGAERIANNGDTHLDFEFFQAGVSIPKACGDGTTKFSGHRTQGDFLAAIDFTTGGSLGGNTLYVWSCDGLLHTSLPAMTCDPVAPTANAAYVALPGTDPRQAAFTFGVNGGIAGSGKKLLPNIIGCGGWVCRDGSTEVTSADQVATNDFMEGGVNLDTLGFTGCVSTFIPHTRSSQSFTSVLKDFGGPISFNTCSLATTPSAAAVEINHPVSDTATVDGFTGTPGTVTFTVFGPFSSAPTATSCSGTPAATFPNVTTSDTVAPAHYTSPNFTPTTPGIYQFVATYAGGLAFSKCGDTTEQFRAVDANITISPLAATNAIGSGHVFTATVKVNDGSGYVNAPDGTNVTFSLSNNSAGATLSGANPCITSGGTCSITVTSTGPGQVTITATTTVTVGGVSLTRATNDGKLGDGPNAVKTFVDANINISPLTATNEVGNGHLFTATVKINDGSGAGYVLAPDGTQVTFSLSSNTAGASISGTNPCTTSGGTGSCSVTVTSSNPGQVTVAATTTLSVGGVSLTRTTNDGKLGDGSNGVKTFVDANISISPATATNLVATNHVLTATVQINDGSGAGYVLAPDNTPITFSIIGGPGTFVGSSSCLTSGGTGSCTATITSNVVGTTEIRATTTLTVNTVTLTRATGDTHVGDSADAFKTWIPVSPTIQTTPGGTVVIGSGATLNDSATLAGGVNPTGTITFTLFDPTNTAVYTDVVTVSGNGTYTTATGSNPGGFLPTSTGVYHWVAAYSGDANNNPISSNASDEPETVSPASPSINTTPGGTVVIGSGARLTDSATLSGGFNPTGTITFALFDPSNAAVYTDVVTVSGNGTYTTATGNNPGGFLPTSTGTYQWQASYSGDSNNNGATSSVGAEPEVVAPASPSIQTTPGGTIVIGSGAKLTDSATLSGGFNPTGTITFTLFNPSSAAVYTDVVTVSGNGNYDTSMGNNPGGFLPTIAGTYQWQATYSGDANNNGATSSIGAEPEVVTKASPTLATLQTSPASIQMNTTVTISDSATLTGAFNPGGTMTFTLVGPNSCTTTALGPITVSVTGATTSTGNQTFSPTAAGTYYWVASYSGDANNNPAAVGCGDPNEKVTVLAPTAQITPTGTTCQQFASGTASTLTTINYSVSGGNISSDNPGVFFYYEKVTITGGQTITVNQTSSQPAYRMQVLNSSTSQVQVYDASCNSVSAGTITLSDNGTTVTISGLPAGTYIFSVKYTPKNLVGLPAPSPSTVNFTFSTALNGSTVSGSTQGISLVKQ